jgi:hypothetical protein
LLTIFPIATPILAAFAHRTEGGAAAVHLLRGLAVGVYSLTAYFTTLALGLTSMGPTLGFAAAAGAALTTQALVLRIVNGRRTSAHSRGAFCGTNARGDPPVVATAAQDDDSEPGTTTRRSAMPHAARSADAPRSRFRRR